MAATLVATVWMARQQDIAAQAASRQMVAGGLKSFVERTKVTLLDYAVWTDAYDNILAGDIDWIASNISDSDTFDLVVVQRPHDTALGLGRRRRPADGLAGAGGDRDGKQAAGRRSVV